MRSLLGLALVGAFGAFLMFSRIMANKAIFRPSERLLPLQRCKCHARKNNAIFARFRASHPARL